MKRYPYQVSGGQAQRIMLAMALVLDPKIIVARRAHGQPRRYHPGRDPFAASKAAAQNGAAILYITHDLGVVSRVADDVAVIYAGSIMEQAKARDLFERPTNPYTHALLQSLPRIDVRQQVLQSIRGSRRT